MICEKLDELDAAFCAVRTQRGLLFFKGALTFERQQEFDREEQARHIAIMDHKLFGHWPLTCPGN